MCDTSYDTVDKETENWLISHLVHHILVNFVLCEQFTDNLLMAHPASQQEAVPSILKEGWQA